MVVGLVGCGAMGSAIGARLRDGGVRVIVALERRSARTKTFAARERLDDVGTLEELVAEADVVLSVVPPEAAVEAARAVAAAARDSRPLVADLNAVSPQRMTEIEALLAATGLETVDGAISGPPPHAAGTTRVYLSGEQAPTVAALPFDGVERVVVADEIGLASAVKMCTASVYKGRVALLAQALRTAHAHGVVAHVLDDLAGSGLADRKRTGATLARASAKAWRYVGEMDEIAATQAAAGLTPELFHALSRIYAELSERAAAEAPEDVSDEIDLDTVLRRLATARSAP